MKWRTDVLNALVVAIAVLVAKFSKGKQPAEGEGQHK